VQADAILKLAGPTDRVYLPTRATCTIDDKVNRRRITVAKENSDVTVVWNPWSDKIVSFADFDAQEWTGFLCVETCNVWDRAVTLGPGQTHVMRSTISVKPD